MALFLLHLMLVAEYARKGPHYMGAKLYNDLPIDGRTAENKKDFKEKLDLFLKVK